MSHSDHSTLSLTLSEPQLDDKPYVYAAVRTDIPLPQQLVQLGHAAFEAGLRWHSPDEEVASLIALEVPNLRSLGKLKRKLDAAGVGHHLFHEPDFGIGDSALATQPLRGAQRQALAGYPLWGAQSVAASADLRVLEVAHG